MGAAVPRVQVCLLVSICERVCLRMCMNDVYACVQVCALNDMCVCACTHMYALIGSWWVVRTPTVGSWAPDAHTCLSEQQSEPVGPFASVSEVTSLSLDYGTRMYSERGTG